MNQIFFQGKCYPLIKKEHSLKRSKLEILADHALATLCYDLSQSQKHRQLTLLKEKLYRLNAEKTVSNLIGKLQARHPRHINSVRFKSMKSRWGSASSKKNLNFNIDLAKLPPAIQEYIVVHEYCHLFEMNHSKKYWQIVSQFTPNWKTLRTQLRQIERQWQKNKSI